MEGARKAGTIARMPCPGKGVALWPVTMRAVIVSFYSVEVKILFSMRAILIFFALSFLIFFGTQFALNYAFPPYQSLTSEFFDLISHKEYKTAYNLLSSDFKSKIDFQHFEAFIDNSEYKNYRNGRWFNAILGSQSGSMQGVITLKSFRQIPLDFSFVKEPDVAPNLPMNVSAEVKAAVGPFMTWKIQDIRYSRPLP